MITHTILSTRIRQLAALSLCLGMVFNAACASTGTNRSVIDLAVNSNGVVLLEGQPVMLQHLPRALKREGATRTTGIYVDVPKDASPELLRELTETLATAGYARLIFRTPVKASAVTE